MSHSTTLTAGISTAPTISMQSPERNEKDELSGSDEEDELPRGIDYNSKSSDIGPESPPYNYTPQFSDKESPPYNCTPQFSDDELMPVDNEPGEGEKSPLSGGSPSSDVFS